MHKQWNHVHVSWEEYRDADHMCRDEINKSMTQLKLNLARDMKNNNNGFKRFVDWEKKIK